MICYVSDIYYTLCNVFTLILCACLLHFYFFFTSHNFFLPYIFFLHHSHFIQTWFFYITIISFFSCCVFLRSLLYVLVYERDSAFISKQSKKLWSKQFTRLNTHLLFGWSVSDHKRNSNYCLFIMIKGKIVYKVVIPN